METNPDSKIAVAPMQPTPDTFALNDVRSCLPDFGHKEAISMPHVS